MWHLKTTTLPLVIGALGIVAKTAPNYVSQIPGAPGTELQKITLMCTAHILRKRLFNFFLNRDFFYIVSMNVV